MSQYNSWNKYILDLQQVLHSVMYTNRDGSPLSTSQGFDCFVRYGTELRQNKKTLFCVGNGASASMCSHFAADIMKNAHIRTSVFTDLALLTAIGNDLSFEDIYAHPLSLGAQAGDCLLAISSSGASPNIIKALRSATDLGIHTISLTGMHKDNLARRMADLNIYFPANTYSMAETTHATLLHYWTDALVATSVSHAAYDTGTWV